MKPEAGAPVSSPPAETGSHASTRAAVAAIVALDLERMTARPLVAGRGPSRFSVVQSGPGPAAASAAARDAIADGAVALVSWGLAGGLAAPASPGALLVPARALSADGVAYPTDSGWRRAVCAALAGTVPVIAGDIACTDRVLCQPAQKQSLAARTGAVATDMESAAIAAAAARARIPCLIVRAIADGPDDELPATVESWVTAEGATRLAPVVRALFEPRTLVRVVMLARRSGAARAALETAARCVAQMDFDPVAGGSGMPAAEVRS